MHRMFQIACAVTVVAVMAATTAAQLQSPADWRVRLDDQGTVTTDAEPKAGAMRFVGMPPGWHVTTAGPGAVLYHPDYQGRGNFSVEAEIFLFPGDSREDYGVFIGGSGLDTVDKAHYISFVARRDGRVAINRAGGTSPIVGWRTGGGLTAHPGEGTAKAILRVDVNPTEIVFSTNGTEAIKIPRSGLRVDGHFGFRVGSGMNIHASRLDVTHRLAPVPIK
jgi:hypothetical protein